MPVYSKNAAPGLPNSLLQGQKTQYFLPFVPVDRVRDFW